MSVWSEPNVSAYLLALTRFNDPLLTEMEQRAAEERFPIIGPHVGPWLYLLSRLANARRVYELGSGYGYSTWYFCRAVADNLRDSGVGEGEQGWRAALPGEPSSEAWPDDPPRVVHTVWDSKLSADARVNLDRAGFNGLVEYVDGEAVAALTAAPEGWDIIFMDIDKEGYPNALPVIEQKLRIGGLLIVDNLIWSGTVADESDQRESTVAIRKLSQMLKDSSRWQLVMLPLRDGVGVARFNG